MKIADLIRKNLTSCAIHDTLERAAQLMWDADVGCLPVIDEHGHVAGMITDRDTCMAAYTQGLPLRAIPVTAAMATHVYSCTESEDVAAVARRMSHHQIRRMPVIDDRGHPIGIISVNDLARAAASGKLPAAQITSTLAAVTAPRPIMATAA